jgi:hypothetical protein
MEVESLPCGHRCTPLSLRLAKECLVDVLVECEVKLVLDNMYAERGSLIAGSKEYAEVQSRYFSSFSGF